MVDRGSDISTTEEQISGAVSSAHADALAELSRPDPPESLWERVVASLVPLARSSPGWLRAVVATVVVAAVAGGWVWLRRPVDPVAGLPRVSDPVATSSTALEPTAASVTGSTAAGALTTGSVTVHVAGAVQHPGVVTLPAGSRAVDAVDAAGGLAPGADADRVNLAAPLADGTRLAVPLVGQPIPTEVAVPSATPAGSGSGPTAATPGAPVDLNTADVTQLDTLPGVGPATAAAIVAHREEHGPFSTVDGLLDVRGIGEGRLDAVRDLVTVGR